MTKVPKNLEKKLLDDLKTIKAVRGKKRRQKSRGSAGPRPNNPRDGPNVEEAKKRVHKEVKQALVNWEEQFKEQNPRLYKEKQDRIDRDLNYVMKWFDADLSSGSEPEKELHDILEDLIKSTGDQEFFSEIFSIAQYLDKAMEVKGEKAITP